ncbi:hypothetical protein OS493_025410 [Desmophyllum pertusum]|uniref:Uncharacterized protein n=1 Tax=Desmophyllum pertusum TaxID=174260 RepID=A0A9X0CKP8_9CNID|nr:hypothetical protein OS493_025410 [Desmophyllum pertusum]
MECCHFCSLFHSCLIVYEIVDKLVDFAIVRKYEEGNLSLSNPKDSVYDALFTFFVIGLNITIIRTILYLWRIQLYRTGDDSQDRTHDAINLWMSLAKALFEAFPQSTIAKFFFGDCATTDGMKILVQAFDVFSILPFIMFVCYLFYYYCEHDEGPNRITVIVMVITFIFSVVGFIFACLSINDYNERCWLERVYCNS